VRTRVALQYQEAYIIICAR